jgi:predicted small secreted protein
MKNIILAILILVICAALAGCGETISGAGKDVTRMGTGINTFFFRQ